MYIYIYIYIYVYIYVCVCVCVCVIIKKKNAILGQFLTGVRNKKIYFSLTGCHTKAKKSTAYL